MLRYALTIAALALCANALAADRVLLVVSSAGTEEDPESGYEFDELTQAYWVFTDNGFDVDIASPAGGHPVPEEVNERWSFNARFLADKVAMALATNTLRIDSVNGSHYEALFIIGGSGAGIDLPDDKALQSLVANMDAAQRVIGAVCHGPAALVNINIDGTPFVKGRQLTSFTGEEEALFSELEEPAQALEAQLTAHGADFSEASIMGLHTVTDGRLVTGQNPFSTALTAEAVIVALGKTPVSRDAYASENSMRIAQLAREQGAQAAAAQLAKDPKAAEPMFIALLGYYELKAAANDQALKDAVALMEVALPYFEHDKVRMALAGGYQRLGQMDNARRVLNELLQDKPDFTEAQEMLAALTD